MLFPCHSAWATALAILCGPCARGFCGRLVLSVDRWAERISPRG